MDHVVVANEVIDEAKHIKGVYNNKDRL